MIGLDLFSQKFNALILKNMIQTTVMFHYWTELNGNQLKLSMKALVWRMQL